jgi:hypothetical protein
MSLIVNKLFYVENRRYFLQSILFVPHNGVFMMNFASAYKGKRAATYR